MLHFSRKCEKFPENAKLRNLINNQTRSLTKPEMLYCHSLELRSQNWPEPHEVTLARKVRASELWIYKPRTVDRGNIWRGIADRLNAASRETPKFSVNKKSFQEHFNLKLDKLKAKRNSEAKMSGEDVEDSELDTLLEEISEK